RIRVIRAFVGSAIAARHRVHRTCPGQSADGTRQRQYQLPLHIRRETRDIPAWVDTRGGFMKAIPVLLPNLLQGKIRLVHQAALTALVCAVAATASAQRTPGEPEKGREVEKPPSPTPLPAVAQIGRAREIKLAENTWFRFGAQVQLWFKAAQDRIRQSDGSDGQFALDFYGRRLRFFTTGSVVKNVFFNVLLEAANVGRADPNTGAKTSAVPQFLDAYGQVKFTDAFWLSGGSILMPLTRNGLQPTTTYVSIDSVNIAGTPGLQLNTNVSRDLG